MAPSYCVLHNPPQRQRYSEHHEYWHGDAAQASAGNPPETVTELRVAHRPVAAQVEVESAEYCSCPERADKRVYIGHRNENSIHETGSCRYCDRDDQRGRHADAVVHYKPRYRDAGQGHDATYRQVERARR